METIKYGLDELITKGGIYRGVRGSTPREVLAELIGVLSPSMSVGKMPAATMPAAKLLEAVLEREALMSTGIGGGIALPHPRNPIFLSESDQYTALAFLERPVSWNSLDGEQVDTLFLIVSASAKQHLQTLSEINYFCRMENFHRLLKKRASLEELLSFIKETEKNWK